MKPRREALKRMAAALAALFTSTASDAANRKGSTRSGGRSSHGKGSHYSGGRRK